jgi:UDP-N-acetylglucosamine 2-epimerase (non-hydrolysing)
MSQIFHAIRSTVTAHPDVHLIFPMHKNPAVRAAAMEAFSGLPRVHLIEPVEYKAFSNLMGRVYLILTDSGGIQEEAPSLGKPVLVLRDTTERPEAVASGTVLLAGTSADALKSQLERLLCDKAACERFRNLSNPYGDGHAARRIVDILEQIGPSENLCC